MSQRSALSALSALIALLAGPIAGQDHICTVTAAGTGCAPLQVAMTPQGNSNGHDLTLTATGLHHHTIGAMVWGMESINMPIIPGSLCPLLTNYVWGHTFMTDPQGTYTWSRNWPGSFHGWFYMQMGSVETDANGVLDVRTTDCWLVECLLP